MASNHIDWARYEHVQGTLSLRRRCDDVGWGLEAELDRIVSASGNAAKAREAARRGASRRRQILRMAAADDQDAFRVHVGGGWEIPVMARLDLAQVTAGATTTEGRMLGELARGEHAVTSAAFRKRLQRFRARVLAA